MYAFGSISVLEVFYGIICLFVILLVIGIGNGLKMFTNVSVNISDSLKVKNWQKKFTKSNFGTFLYVANTNVRNPFGDI